MIRPRSVGRRCERAAGLQMCAAAAEERLEEIERKARLAGNDWWLPRFGLLSSP